MRIGCKNYPAGGFTLIELLITCAIIAILVAIAIPSYMTGRLKADEHKAIVNLNSIYQAEKLYWHSRPLGQEEYTSLIDDLDSYVEFSQDDGDWSYVVDTAGTDEFVIMARHLDNNGTIDGMEMYIDETGRIWYSYK
ncbi:MAG: prepilin-type N-terminal cleavage/methylation domain-containing protein [Candidatus Omnitrophica bacterium]|jgi:prepilin-type N-terminal cleavage/methylation domain|nr:prepilin-type N-terminal cleavage/methylation domain-containing protein [Candidatus Omnitrophota bacterium]